MKLATFETAGSERIGAVINNEVVDLQAAYKARYGKPSLILSDMQTLSKPATPALIWRELWPTYDTAHSRLQASDCWRPSRYRYRSAIAFASSCI